MRQSEARDLRSFLAEPVEEIIEVGANTPTYGVGARFIAPDTRFIAPDTFINPPDTGVQLINAPDTNTDLELDLNVSMHGAGVRFARPWEGTGGQLHEVGARFTQPLAPLAPEPSEPVGRDDLAEQQTMPMKRIAAVASAHSGASPLRPYRLQRYQSRGAPAAPARSGGRVYGLRAAGKREWLATADLAPAPQKVVPVEASPALKGLGRRRRMIYAWLVLFTLFLLFVLGGIVLDMLVAGYR